MENDGECVDPCRSYLQRKEGREFSGTSHEDQREMQGESWQSCHLVGL